MAQSEDANEILPNLWLGNAKASMNENFIRQNQIQVVFNCTKNLPFHPMIPIKYRIPVDDNLEEEEIRNLELWSSEIAFKILGEYKTGKAVLIHCMAGMQRSAASMAMMMIVHLNLHAQEVMQMIREKRPIAFYPRANFGRSIDTFDRKFHGEILPEMKKLQIRYKSE
jgi:predicted ATP-dependent Lon-type protease|uniref:Dual specificity phosphatase catalytic domain n=1 Tax=viral metagenome TaxID=1070528 RepID=A0A6C0DG03_9ZZZZ